MKLLTITEYSKEYHKLLRQIWSDRGYNSPSWINPGWLEFKIKQYDFYLRECGCKLEFEGMENVLNEKYISYIPGYTEEKLYQDIDDSINHYNKCNTWIYRLLWRLKNTFQRQKKYAA